MVYIQALKQNAFSILRIRSPEYADHIKYLNIRFSGLPIETLLRKIGAEQIGKLLTTNGIIVRSTAIRPLITVAAYSCTACGEQILIPQDEQQMLTPTQCPMAACKSRKGFKFLPNESKYIDSQNITIQEKQEDLPAGQLPRQLNIELRDDLVDYARPGDRITVVGTLDLIQRKGRGGTLRSFDIILTANNIEVIDREKEFDITPEDEEEIKEIAQDPWVFRRLMGSMAPSLYGLEAIKEAVMYLLFGGVYKELTDVRIRGDINVLLLGDPGTGKSQLLAFAAKTAPRGILTTGRGSTAAGLTAAVVKEGGVGSFILEAGALVLGDKGICCIDEMDKMRDEDRGAIHPAMEQQIVSIAKGGIVATLNARTSVLAAANPTLGRYNAYQTVAQNINLPIPLLSRFDLIFVLRDLPDTVKDEKLADHILKLHMNAKREDAAPLSIELFRKYISHAKTINPVMTEGVMERFKAFYLKMRSASIEGGEGSAISITARQLESLIRMAEARARAHLREEITSEDADAVIALMQRSMEQVGIDLETGKVDIDLLYSGKPRSLQMNLHKILEVISELERISGTVSDEDLFTALVTDHGIGRTEAAKLIGILMRDGTIFSPRPGSYKRTN